MRRVGRRDRVASTCEPASQCHETRFRLGGVHAHEGEWKANVLELDSTQVDSGSPTRFILNVSTSLVRCLGTDTLFNQVYQESKMSSEAAVHAHSVSNFDPSSHASSHLGGLPPLRDSARTLPAPARPLSFACRSTPSLSLNSARPLCGREVICAASNGAPLGMQLNRRLSHYQSPVRNHLIAIFALALRFLCPLVFYYASPVAPP